MGIWSEDGMGKNYKSSNGPLVVAIFYLLQKNLYYAITIFVQYMGIYFSQVHLNDTTSDGFKKNK